MKNIVILCLLFAFTASLPEAPETYNVKYLKNAIKSNLMDEYFAS